MRWRERRSPASACIRDWGHAFARPSEAADSRGVRDSTSTRPRRAVRSASRGPGTGSHAASVRREIDGLLGAHAASTTAGTNWTTTNSSPAWRHHGPAVPRYEAYQAQAGAARRKRREEMRLDEFKPKVLSSFVRNRSSTGSILPLIGDNLAKQMGTAGEQTRTDRMGLLLLISPAGLRQDDADGVHRQPPGRDLHEDQRPGHRARGHLHRPGRGHQRRGPRGTHALNLAFEMGDNVMIYVDDIQHTHPELLQKFISLCDAQRRIEGVYNGKTRTYDLRGRKVAVVMAGNPYTESGRGVPIPDMLANRADTYNLGDIIGDHAEAHLRCRTSRTR